MRGLFLSFITICAVLAVLNPSGMGFLFDFGSNIGASIRFVLDLFQ